MTSAPLGAVLDLLLTADDAEFSRTVGPDAPEPTTPTAAATDVYTYVCVYGAVKRESYTLQL